MPLSRSHAIASIVIGTLELILGVILVVCAFVFSGYGGGHSSAPYWTGFPYLVPGVLGIIAGATKNHGCMVATLVFNIILTILTVIGAIVMTVAVYAVKLVVSTYEAGNCHDIGGSCVCMDDMEHTVAAYDCSYLDSVIPMIVAITVVCYLCAVLALSGSILGCVATCCAPPPPPTVMVAQPNFQPGVVITSTNTTTGGGMVPPPAPYPQQYPVAAGHAYAAPPGYGPTHDKVPLVV